jgi:acetyl-CoA acetyltransferase
MQKKRKLGRGVTVVGAGMSKFGMFQDKDSKDLDSKDLFVEAFSEMQSSVDKGLDTNDIDALYVGNFANDFFIQQSHWGPILSDIIGLTPKPATRTEGACASSALAFREGVFAIASGFSWVAWKRCQNAQRNSLLKDWRWRRSRMRTGSVSHFRAFLEPLPRLILKNMGPPIEI